MTLFSRSSTRHLKFAAQAVALVLALLSFVGRRFDYIFATGQLAISRGAVGLLTAGRGAPWVLRICLSAYRCVVRRKACCRRGQTERQHENRTLARSEFLRHADRSESLPLTDVTMLSDDENGPIGLTDVVVVDAVRPALSAFHEGPPPSFLPLLDIDDDNGITHLDEFGLDDFDDDASGGRRGACRSAARRCACTGS